MRNFIMFFAVLLLSGATTASSFSASEKVRGIDSVETSPVECTFTIKGTFNGTVVDVQITVSDVSLIECGLLKLGVKKAIK